MAYDYAGAQRRAHSQIKKYGVVGALRRNGVDRPCLVGVIDFNPRGKELILEGQRRALVSSLAPDLSVLVAPDHELDLLIWNGEVCLIPVPVRGIRPAGTVIYYDLTVTYSARA